MIHKNQKYAKGSNVYVLGKVIFKCSDSHLGFHTVFKPGKGN